ncbi:hypothetical protein C7S18_08925 [Ahniella affigens]|uniref:IPTL-CTERM protein sorting domain-containing protein n=1 Tax=Ahniella affigens TaxID=2021234 RepID=A0A2P1PR31_9GAMM|nr:hypothetical protein [Ahniella affigens]AVP97307.1 hypothetical protein C7S18_08925 [Ahniella affigens]
MKLGFLLGSALLIGSVSGAVSAQDRVEVLVAPNGSQLVDVQFQNTSASVQDIRYFANVPDSLSNHTVFASGACSANYSGGNQIFILATAVPPNTTVNCQVQVSRDGAPVAGGATLVFQRFSLGSASMHPTTWQIGPQADLQVTMRQVAPFPNQEDQLAHLEVTVTNPSDHDLGRVDLGPCPLLGSGVIAHPLLSASPGACLPALDPAGDNCFSYAYLESLPARSSRVCYFERPVNATSDRLSQARIVQFQGTAAPSYFVHDSNFENDFATLTVLLGATPIPGLNQVTALVLLFGVLFIAWFCLTVRR